MRKLAVTALATLLFLAPGSASAGFTASLSLGSGLTLESEVDRIPTNIMLAPGYEFLILRAELGVVADLGDVENADFDLQLRPMLVIAPPFPVYGRLIIAFVNLLETMRDWGWGRSRWQQG